MASEKNHQKYQKPLAPYQSAKLRPPAPVPASKLGKAGGQRRNRLTLWSFQRAVRVSELGCWDKARMRARGAGMRLGISLVDLSPGKKGQHSKTGLSQGRCIQAIPTLVQVLGGD
ncbi:hypothetical protein AXF13_09330 [Desulfovibrio fairfieldensis]|uniref:Uncharacterized protein n=1 Tax=Desulfovibrio fairfieldensis TaxID=44742 RepID=A0A0X8JK85_9BACT|nr:hypothetical protein AXF13_09330 [Desulfovibrio fairfieldensis]